MIEDEEDEYEGTPDDGEVYEGEENDMLAAILENLRERETNPQPAVVFTLLEDVTDGPEPEKEARAPIRIGQPMCVACGWSIFECTEHDEEDERTLKDHADGKHERCDLDACPEDQR